VKLEKIWIIVAIIGTFFAIFYYALGTVVLIPSASEVISKILAPSTQTIVKTPAIIESGVDYGLPITPLRRLPKGNSTIMIVTVGAAGQMLPFTQIFLSSNNETYGPYISGPNGIAVISNITGGKYLLSGFYKGFSSTKTIIIPKDCNRLYELKFPVYAEIAGIPLSFGASFALIVGVVILIIVIVILVSEYLRWRKRRLEQESKINKI